jgi:hypothetical protein
MAGYSVVQTAAHVNPEGDYCHVAFPYSDEARRRGGVCDKSQTKRP